MNQRATGYEAVTPRETERKEFLPDSASLTLLWIFQWARYFDRFCLARIVLFSFLKKFEIIIIIEITCTVVHVHVEL